MHWVGPPVVGSPAVGGRSNAWQALSPDYTSNLFTGANRSSTIALRDDACPTCDLPPSYMCYPTYPCCHCDLSVIWGRARDASYTKVEFRLPYVLMVVILSDGALFGVVLAVGSLGWKVVS